MGFATGGGPPPTETCPKCHVTVTDAELSKLLWDAAESAEMFAVITEKQTGHRDDYNRNLVDRINTYRASRGWSPNGFGGEDDPTCPTCQHPDRLHAHHNGCTQCDCRPVPLTMPEPDWMWRAGDPCRSCGSTNTYVDDDGVPTCNTCHRTDGDE